MKSNKKWCTRCNRYHDSLPVDEKKIIQDHAMDIAREMDAEILLHLIDQQVIENLVKELRQAWYDENNKPKDSNDPRDIGLRVGKKSGLNMAINILSKYKKK
jgi:hypothetical protein